MTLPVSIAGRTALYFDNWISLTGDPYVLSCVKGVKIEFNALPRMAKMPLDFLMTSNEKSLVDEEVQGMILKGAIVEVNPCEDQFVSNIFLRPKKNGTMRPIINLKKLNTFVRAPHFKMEHLLTFLPFIRRGMFLTSLDLKDAYFSIPINSEFRKYLRFSWRDRLFEFQCLCFGLSSAPYTFTKVMKPIFSQLRREGVCSSYYIDDSIYADMNSSSLSHQTNKAKCLLESLGFVVNTKKSSMVPSTTITHLGFVIDTVSMKVSLPQEKVDRIIEICKELVANERTTVRQLARAIGLIVSSFLAINFGQLHYRQLEVYKFQCLQVHNRYDREVDLPVNVCSELTWWVENVESANGRDITSILGLVKSQMEIYSDASKLGWGAALVSGGKVLEKCSGMWSTEESNLHINLLELKAIQFALCCFEHSLKGDIAVMCDNTTAVAYVNKYGGCHSHDLDSLSKEIWHWCILRQINLLAMHIAGTDNVLADDLSRSFSSSVEWSLDGGVFQALCDVFERPTIDLFASRLNHKLPCYFSWKPDPGSAACNAFGVDWDGLYGYAFPPFNLIGRVLCKVEHDKAKILLICPFWPTQPWFPHLCSLLIAVPVALPCDLSVLRCPVSKTPHPLLPRLKLVACLLSRDHSLRQEFQRMQSTSLPPAGSRLRRRITPPTSNAGLNFANDSGCPVTAVPLRQAWSRSC